MVSSTPLRTALERARRLQGRFIGDIAREYQTQGYELTGGKGWIGNLMEHIVAGAKDEHDAGAQDLTQAGVEIKSFGVGKGASPIEAWEDLRLRTVDYDELVEQPWQESKLLMKIRATVMVPYWRPPKKKIQTCRNTAEHLEALPCRDPTSACMEGEECTCSRLCPCRGSRGEKTSDLAEWVILTPFIWIPSSKSLKVFKEDWIKHALLVREGGEDPLGGLEANFGEMLRAATHGHDAATNWRRYTDTDGETWQTKGRSWMLRKGFVSRLCEENIPGPWRETPAFDYLS